MNKILSGALGLIILSPLSASADITVKLPSDAALDSLNYNYTTILNLSKPRGERGTVSASVPVKDNIAVVPTVQADGGVQYFFNLGNRNVFTVYANGEDAITTEVTSLNPAKTRTTGSEVYVGINEVEDMVNPILQKFYDLRKQENPDRDAMQALIDDYNNTIKDYIKENPTQPSSVYALMQLDGEDFVELYPLLSERAKTSILFPVVENQKVRIEKSLEKERRQKEMAKGDVTAPDFTLLDLDGKEVSLSQFKGKWVILDFWGSWCIWCIKGFPELKEAYQKYKDVLEIVGVDCNETEEAWRAGVKKYELPWVNVYNPKTTNLLDEYGVQGFPTKAIIDPEGKIRNITTGHNPGFFTILSELIGK
ncbi:MAG: TlpA family protein disulfide reductase [Muribaculaceae bacterium]|nr:TlpA family protein disulfide reductase [Muribaculaceae bacterium]